MDHTPEERHDVAVDELRAAATAAELAAANAVLDALDDNFAPLSAAEVYEWAATAAQMIEGHGHRISDEPAAALLLRLARYLPDQVVLNMAEIRWQDRDIWVRFPDQRALRWIHDVQTLVVAYPVTVMGEARVVTFPITPPRPVAAA